MAHDGLFGLTSGSPSYTKTQLTANTRPVNAVWWIACACRRVSVHSGLCVCVCVCVCVGNMCAWVSPWRASMAGWCIRWHVNYSGFKRGLSWVEVSGGLMAAWWSERLPVGKRCGDGEAHVGSYMWSHRHAPTHTGEPSHQTRHEALCSSPFM